MGFWDRPAPGNFSRMSLPNGLFIDNDIRTNRTVLMTALSNGTFTRSISFNSQQTFPIWSVTTIKPNLPIQSWPRAGATATECALWYCVKEYQSSVQNGTVFESAETVAATPAADSWQLLEGQPRPDETDAIGQALDPVLRANHTDLMIGDGFNVSQSAVASIKHFLTSLTATPEWPVNTTEINGWVLSDGGDKGLVFEPSIMQPLFDNTDLRATFAALAASMSATIRIDADGGTVVTGRAGVPVTFVQVRWAYLTLPATLVAAGAVFLGMVIIQTRRQKLAIWRSSLLPVLAFGHYVGDGLREKGHAGIIEERWKDVLVSLSTSEPQSQGHRSMGLLPDLFSLFAES